MYRREKILNEMRSYMGWRQEIVPELMIDEDLTKSDSGMYYQDANGYLSLANIRSRLPDYERLGIIKYVAGSYKKDQVVFLKEEVYKAKQDTDKDPTSDEWEKLSLLSKFLREKTDESILKVVQSVYSTKLHNKATKSIVDRATLFSSAGRLSDTRKPTKSIVGMEIVPMRDDSVTTLIEKIAFQFVGKASITLFLMHDSSVDPIEEKIVEIDSKGNVVWVDLNWHLPYRSDKTNAGGSWYICYNEKDLGEECKSIIKSKDWSKSPCVGCNPIEVKDWRLIKENIEIYPFRVDQDVDTANFQMWDVEDMIYTNQSNYGLNMSISVKCDLTDLMLAQKDLLIEAIKKQVQIDFIQYMITNPENRINSTSYNKSINANEARFYLFGDIDSKRKSGLLYELEKDIENIEYDMRGLSRVCSPCRNGGLIFSAT